MAKTKKRHNTYNIFALEHITKLPIQEHTKGEEDTMSHQYLFKYIIIGDSGVGKSCLLLQVCLVFVI